MLENQNPVDDGPPLGPGETLAARFPGPPKVLDHDDVGEEYAIVRMDDAMCGLMVWAKWRGQWEPNPSSMRPVVRVLLERAEAAEAERNRLLAVIQDVHSQHADDLCWLPTDVNQIFVAAGLPPQDLRVGDTEAMRRNCDRYIACLEQGGPWRSYAELEAEIARLRDGRFTDAEWMDLCFATDPDTLRRFAVLYEEHRAKRHGLKQPQDEVERQRFKALYAGQCEPCCECGTDYPRGDLVIDGEIYCPACRGAAQS